MCSSCNCVKRIILLAFLIQTGIALNLNRTATQLELQASSRILDNDQKDDPLNLKEMDPRDYYDDFYNKTEWEESDPHFSPETVGSLIPGTNGADNLCLRGHFVPELLVLGGIKTSTTSLCTMLRRSPAIMWPGRQALKINSTEHPASWKEGHYFDWHKVGNVGYMATDFPICSTAYRLVAVDASARSSSDPEVPGRISEWYGAEKSKLKFVLILREPLARLHSHYYHSLRDKWCLAHFQTNFSEIINSVLWANWTEGRKVPRMPRRILASPGCGDFMDGSLYVKQLQNYFEYFQPSQFTLIPFLYNVDPGNAGRSSEFVSTFLWSKLGVAGVPGDLAHSNDHKNPPLEEDLTEWQINRMKLWFDQVTGPALIANMVRSTAITLYQYTGDPNDADQIAQWLGANW